MAKNPPLNPHNQAAFHRDELTPVQEDAAALDKLLHTITSELRSLNRDITRMEDKLRQSTHLLGMTYGLPASMVKFAAPQVRTQTNEIEDRRSHRILLQYKIRVLQLARRKLENFLPKAEPDKDD